MNLSTLYGIPTIAVDKAFSSTDLVNGIYTLAGTTVISAVVDESGRVVLPDIIYGTVNTTIDLSNFVSTMTGSWKIRFAQGTSSSGSGGMWTLVERWEPSAPATSHTFSGLNGDVDRRYKIVSNIVSGNAGQCIFLRPNNDAVTSNYHCQVHQAYGSGHSVSQESNNTGINLSNLEAVGCVTTAEVELWAKSGINRFSMSHACRSQSGGSIRYATDVYDAVWRNSSDNITSLVLAASAASSIGVGSCVELWKLAQ
jgi:hypothetical protein